jgi:hypothetical protein
MRDYRDWWETVRLQKIPPDRQTWPGPVLELPDSSGLDVAVC